MLLNNLYSKTFINFIKTILKSELNDINRILFFSNTSEQILQNPTASYLLEKL